ncbi:MAG: hypothetical protein IKJ75_00875 [Clostridia bacterium]|nr:hypothetical protein [Clostridia bacterium]
MFSCETMIIICIILIVFLVGLCTVLLNVDYFIKYDEEARSNGNEDTFFTNAEVMRIADVLSELFE